MERVDKRVLLSEKNGEIRVAVYEGGELVELFFEDLEESSIAGNIYLGRIESYVDSLEAYFVNIGTGKNAFLRRRDTLGDSVFQKGDKVLVQVKKDPTGRKGPQVSSYISLTGRHVVFLPHKHFVGVSRKIADPSQRKRLYKLGKKISKATDNRFGVIFRTVSEDADDTAIIEEYNELKELWQKIHKKFKRSRKPQIIYEEPDILSFIFREKIDQNVREIVYDTPTIGEVLRENLQKTGLKPKLHIVEGDAFERFGVYRDMDRLLGQVVELESGGNIVLDQTEAMLVIDVNTAGHVSKNSLEETAHRTNLEAAREIARQLRLRNIGGIVMVDFIHTDVEEHKSELVEKLSEFTSQDKGSVRIFGFTNLGLLELTRKRSKRSLSASLTTKCPVCRGSGRVISPRAVFMRLVRELGNLATDSKLKTIELNVHQNLSGYLTPQKRKELSKKLRKTLKVSYSWKDPESYEIKLLN